MDFQLNPNAAEFVPGSPQLAGLKHYLKDDSRISGSPLKEVSPMDDIQVPSESEFEKEVCRRPREVEAEGKECPDGDFVQRSDYTEFMADRQKLIGMSGNLDDSEISSTKAEFGDESASFLTASEFHRTSISAVDESFSSSERDYDISKDPMAMSFTPGDFEAAFEKGVDLNAVHDLSTVDLDDNKNGTIGEEEMRGNVVDLLSDVDQPTYDSAFAEELQTGDLLQMESSQLEETEHTFIEHANLEKPKPEQDILEFPPERQPSETEAAEQQDFHKSEPSPLTDNYSTEFESEKEPISDDNEQPLSPSSADIDETKPMDEASEEAAPLMTDSQKETCVKETDTPSSLSPVPDAMECSSPKKEHELASSLQCMHISSTSATSELHQDIQEAVPEQYSHSDFSYESRFITTAQPDTVKDPIALKDTDSVKDAFDVDAKPVEEKTESAEATQSTESAVLEEVKKNLMDYAADGEVCRKTPGGKVESEVTPPPTPQEAYDKITQDMNDLVFPEPATTTAKVAQSPEPEDEDLMREEVCQLEGSSKEAPLASEEPQGPEVVQETTAALNLSESMQEFTGLEKQLLPEKQVPVDTTRTEPEPEILEEEPVQDLMEHEPVVKPVVEPVVESVAKPVVESIVKPEPEFVDEPQIQEAGKMQEPTLEIKAEMKEEPVAEVLADTKEPEIEEAVEALPETPVEAPVAAPAEPLIESPAATPVEAPVETPAEPAAGASVASPEKTGEKSSGIGAVAAAAVAVTATASAAAAAAASAQTKPKASIKSAAKPSKPAATKPAAKSTPTSPSKAGGAATKASAAAKKPATSTTSRPKELDTAKRSSGVSSTTGKTAGAAKPATTAAALKAAAAPKTTSRTSIAATKAKSSTPTAAAKTNLAAAEKKPTANGDVKPLSKPSAAKTTAKPAASTGTTKSSLVKSATSTRTSVGAAASKPRSTSATATSASAGSKPAVKSSSSATSTTGTAAARPKTAPVSSSTAKPRVAGAAKSPMIDKQIKETANKQISLARTTGSTATKTTRTSVSSTSTTTTTNTVKRTSTTKTLTSSPTKKPITGSKTPTRTSSAGTKTTSVTGRVKVVQNGISESMQISNTIIETTKSKIEDDVPKKDLSPVVAPTDNQFIMGSD